MSAPAPTQTTPDIKASAGEMLGVEPTPLNTRQVLCYAAKHSYSSLKCMTLERRAPQPTDVVVQILFCGVCASDVHQAKNEWKNTIYPLVPGHEMVGRVTEVGHTVKKFKVGDVVGVGPIINSCGNCASCKDNLQQYCTPGFTAAFNGNQRFPTKENVTRGGYSQSITVNENYVIAIPAGLDLPSAAPLLCAGITVYSPLRHWKVGKGSVVAICGYGGLGHLAVKIAVALGADVTVLSSNPDVKTDDALRAGAKAVVDASDAKQLAAVANKFDFILSTIPMPHDPMPYIELLRRDGTLCIVGTIGTLKGSLDTTKMVFDRRSIATSVTGSIAESHEMLEFCVKHKIVPDIKLIPISECNDAFATVHDGEAGFRFVLDVSTIASELEKADHSSLKSKLGL